jgi:hypothetical protein
MKRMLFAVAALSLMASASAATPDSKKSSKPWYSVPRSDLRITVDRTTDQMTHQGAVIYGNGVAVWNNSVQFRLDEQRINRILAAFDAAHFENMPPAQEGERLRRRAGIHAGDYSREVIDTWEAEQEREEKHKKDSGLEKLVNSIFTIVTPVAKKGGASAASLTVGLEEVASGRLAPETLSVILLVKPELGRPGREDGFLLRIEDGFAGGTPYTAQGIGAPTRIKLSESQLREIASRLASFDPEAFPINLYATDYVDLRVTVMNRSKNIVARQFAGLTPTKYESQKRFDSLIAWLDETRRTLFPPSSAAK